MLFVILLSTKGAGPPKMIMETTWAESSNRPVVAENSSRKVNHFLAHHRPSEVPLQLMQNFCEDMDPSGIEAGLPKMRNVKKPDRMTNSIPLAITLPTPKILMMQPRSF